MPTLSVSVLPGETHSIGGGEIAVDGENNIIVRNIHGSNIVLNIGKFGEWHELNQTLQDYEEALSYLPVDRLVQRIKLEEKIEQQKKKMRNGIKPYLPGTKVRWRRQQQPCILHPALLKNLKKKILRWHRLRCM